MWLLIMALMGDINDHSNTNHNTTYQHTIKKRGTVYNKGKRKHNINIINIQQQL